MKINAETAATLVANVVAIATMVFGMSQDTADVLMKAAPTIIGGIMSMVTVVTFLINKRKERTEVFTAMVRHALENDSSTVSSAAASDTIIEIAKRVGML